MFWQQNKHPFYIYITNRQKTLLKSTACMLTRDPFSIC